MAAGFARFEDEEIPHPSSPSAPNMAPHILKEPSNDAWSEVIAAWSRRPGVTLFVILFAGNAINCTFSVINLAFPLLSDELHVDESVIIWVVFCPQLVAGMLSTPIGRAADLYGRKRCWFAGCIVHLASMLISGLAPNAVVLIAARALTGIGAALEGPAGGSIAMARFPKERRGYVIAWFTMCGTLSSSLGMVIGGFLLRVTSWRILFLGNAPLVAMVLPFAYFIIPTDAGGPADNNDKSSQGPGAATENAHAAELQDPAGDNAPKASLKTTFDWGGSLMLSLSFGTLLFAFNRAGPWGWRSIPVVLLLSGGCVLMPLFWYHQRRKGRAALLPPFLLSDPLIQSTLLMKLPLVATYMCAFILLPYYLQESRGWSPDRAATLLLWRPLFFSLCSFFIGKKCEALWSCCKSIMAGLISFSSAVILMTFCLDWHWAFAAAGVILQGCGAGLLFPCLATAALTRVAAEDMGVYNGLSMVLDILAACAGQAVTISIVEAFGGMHEPTAYTTAFRFTLPLVAGALLVVFRLLYFVYRLPKEDGGLGSPWSFNSAARGQTDSVSLANNDSLLPTDRSEEDLSPADLEAGDKRRIHETEDGVAQEAGAEGCRVTGQ